MDVNTHTVSTGDDRTLHVLEAGKPDGIPVLVHAGTPGSALVYEEWVEDAAKRGMRLISYDRAGYGSSTPNPGRTVASVADDMRAIAAELGFERMVTWGQSGGGPHSLACAALMPDLVAAAGMLSSPAPYGAEGLDWLAGMGKDNIEEFSAALEGEAALRDYLEPDAAALLAAKPETLAKTLSSLLSPPDVAVLTPGVAQFMIEGILEGIQESREGWVHDDLAMTQPWGFDLADIHVPVLLMHGEQDLMAPVAHARWLAERIPGVEARFLPKDGHLTIPFGRIPEVHAWLLEKMG